jgi:hypothetical protein
LYKYKLVAKKNRQSTGSPKQISPQFFLSRFGFGRFSEGSSKTPPIKNPKKEKDLTQV